MSASRYGSCASHSGLVGGPHMAAESNPPASRMANWMACGMPRVVVVTGLRPARNIAAVPPIDRPCMPRTSVARHWLSSSGGSSLVRKVSHL
ncbi:Uncharacterised protein [Mycobacteroides abscessus subsp. abscessus]|nr:Uncharacterised protein [Mycobacteroides abscessus subsp. abscessus]